MRYEALDANLILYNIGDATKLETGTVAYNPTTKLQYRFAKQGVLTVGDGTTKTTGYTIGDNVPNNISADNANCLMQIYPTDLAGVTTSHFEMAGLGTLNGIRTGGATCDFMKGLRGIFFEAPPVAAGTAVTNTAGVTYKVLDGHVTYNGTKYNQGQKFVVVAGVTSTTATVGEAVGHFALTLPKQLTQGCEAFLSEEFKINELMVGDESNSYWNWDSTGADARADNLTTSTNYFNWTR